MELLIGIVAGGIISWFFSWHFARRGKSDLEANNKILIEQVAKLLGQEAESRKAAQDAINELQNTMPTRARELQEKVAVSQQKTEQVIAALPERVRESLNNRPCPQCGKPSHIDGWGADPTGGVTWWFRCPDHGRFPSHRIEDWID